MATVTDEFIFKLKAQFGEVDAGTAALARLESQISKETSSLAALQTSLSKASRGLKEMQEGFGGKVDISAIAKQRALIAGLESKIGGKKEGLSALTDAMPGIKKLAGAHKEASGTAAETSVSLRKLAGAAAEGDSAFGGLIRSVGKLKAAGPAGVILAIVGAVIAVGVALVAAAIAMTQFAFAAADAARSSRLLTTAAAGSESAGKELDAVISDIANHSPLAREKIAEMGRSLELAHLQGRNMQVTLEAATTATSAIGDAAGKAFTSIAEKSQVARRFLLSKNDFTGLSAELEGTGLAFDDVATAFAKSAGVSMATASMMIRRGQVSVKLGLEAMNDAVQAKFGKTVARQMLSFDNQMSKLKENLGRLFSDVKIDGFLAALKKLTDYFSDANYDGYALKQTLTTIFNGVFGSIEKAGPAIGDFIDGLEIGALTLYIAFLKVKKAYNDAFGGESASQIDWVTAGVYTLAFVVGGLAAVFAVLGGAVALVGGFLYFFIVAPVMSIIDIFDALGDAAPAAFGKIQDYLSSLSLADVGKMIVKSLANGLLGGLPDILEAMGSLAGAILGGLPTKLIMHSPSVLLTRQAEMAAQSIVEPLEDAAPAAHKAMADLGGGSPDFKLPASGGKGGRTISIGEINYSGPASDFPNFRKMFNDMCDEFDGEAPEPT